MIGFDVAQLRESLTKISSALLRPSVGATRWLPADDRKQLTDSLKELTSLFSEVDLQTKHALVGVQTKRSVTAHYPEVVATLSRLSGLLRERFGRVFTSDELRRLESLLHFPAPDFLNALGRSDDENSHSDVLAYLLNPRTAPGTAPSALECLAARLPEPERWLELIRNSINRDEVSVRREVQTGRFWDADPNALERVDIVISGRGFILAIENKVWSKEHAGQTEGYWSWLQSMPGIKGGLLLTPGGVRAQCEHFIPISYAHMAGCFLSEMPARTPEEEVMLAAYFKAVFHNVLGHEAKMILGSVG